MSNPNPMSRSMPGIFLLLFYDSDGGENDFPTEEWREPFLVIRLLDQPPIAVSSGVLGNLRRPVFSTRANFNCKREEWPFVRT
jgi:hypothetical protein